MIGMSIMHLSLKYTCNYLSMLGQQPDPFACIHTAMRVAAAIHVHEDANNLVMECSEGGEWPTGHLLIES